ncbi:MAG: hypothetical protein IPI38_17585 [Gemmatimonadetes bacterium]|nr:hypothetical protein [Gemmatimonadota bacterium]
MHGLEQQKLAVQSAHWPLFRYDPALAAEGKNPSSSTASADGAALRKYAYNETRYDAGAPSRRSRRAAGAGRAGPAGALAPLRVPAQAPAAFGAVPRPEAAHD